MKLGFTLVAFTLGCTITAGTFIILPVPSGKDLVRKWPSWTGIGEGTIIKESTERDGNGKIQKVTFTEEPQSAKTAKPESAKTAWDFLQLFSSLAVPFLLLYLSHQIQQKDKKIADINLHEEALQGYMDRVSDLLINNKANTLKQDDLLLELMKDIVRARTLSLLRSLGSDGERKGSVIRFLLDAELISNYSYIVIDLSYADLKGAKLNGVNLNRVVLSHADLSDADLSHADLNNVNLHHANLCHTNLHDTDLTSAILVESKLNKANLHNADLTNADLTNANLTDADLTDADLTDADLTDADLTDADLRKVKGNNTKLTNTKLSDANRLRLVNQN